MKLLISTFIYIYFFCRIFLTVELYEKVSFAFGYNKRNFQKEFGHFIAVLSFYLKYMYCMRKVLNERKFYFNNDATLIMTLKLKKYKYNNFCTWGGGGLGKLVPEEWIENFI